MYTILLHSSKTARTPASNAATRGEKQLCALHGEAVILDEYLKSLSPDQIKKAMLVSDAMARKTHVLIGNWSSTDATLPTIDLFLGDIYSGLQAQTFTARDREYANSHLFILSGLYGVLRALDEIQPYRLEMGYKLPGNAHDPSQHDITSLYKFWGDKIAQQLPKNQDIINLSAVEYTKAVFPYLKNVDGLKDIKIITPKFLTVSPKTGEPTFVTVHAKIARGAFARWLIQNRIEDLLKLKEFNDIGYIYNEELSTPNHPVFVAQEFKGIGLSIRLSKNA
jgi:cytoplasmic iron level regulating protein YaaA (DUF328/UPF0246 family)